MKFHNRQRKLMLGSVSTCTLWKSCF